MDDSNTSSMKSAKPDYLGEVFSSPEYRNSRRQRPPVDPVLSAVHGQEDGVPDFEALDEDLVQMRHNTPVIEVTRHDHNSADENVTQERAPPSFITRSSSKTSDVSTFCDDHGDDLRHRVEGDQSSNQRPKEDSDLDILEIGRWAALPNSVPAAHKVSISLQKELRNAFQERKNGQEYLPLNKINEIITESRVQEQLKAYYPNIEQDVLNHCTKYICTPQRTPGSSSKRMKYTSCQRIFAILTLIEKLGTIISFIREGITDKDLPFVWVKLDNGDQELRKKLNQGVRVGSFDNWGHFSLQGFRDTQWRVLAPYFAKGGAEKVLFYALDPQDILPWIDDEDSQQTNTEIPSGFSIVRKIRIHPAHHHFGTNKEPNPYFAVKELHSKDKKDFDNEVGILKRYSNRPNSHLVKLLATFSHHESYFLIFPWADGNLRQFWEKHPKPQIDQERTVWMAQQCHAIAVGLSEVHQYRYSHDEEEEAANYQAPDGTLLPAQPPRRRSVPNSNSRDLNDKSRRYGRHGDIKPENILWFRSYDEDNCNDVLKITDFGLTRFHHKITRSNFPVAKLQVSPTYRAPEVEIEDHVGSRYDIWTLGCLYLEFITWYLMGWNAVNDTFSRRRLGNRTGHTLDRPPTRGTASSDIPEDTFFEITRSLSGDSQAHLKKAVLEWIHDLHSHKNCTDFIHEFLDFVQNEMLRINRFTRPECSDVVNNLARMHLKCKEDREYCLVGNPRPARTGSIHPTDIENRGRPAVSRRKTTVVMLLLSIITLCSLSALLYDWAEDPFMISGASSDTRKELF